MNLARRAAQYPGLNVCLHEQLRAATVTISAANKDLSRRSSLRYQPPEGKGPICFAPGFPYGCRLQGRFLCFCDVVARKSSLLQKTKVCR